MSPHDQWTVSSDSAPNAGFGIDMLRLRYPSAARGQRDLRSLTRGHTFKGQSSLVFARSTHPEGWAFYVSHNIKNHMATIEFNPSRVADPLGWHVWSVAHTHRAIATVLAHLNVSGFDRIICEPDAGELMRVDVTRDLRVPIEVGPAARFVDALAPLRRRYARKSNRLYRDQQQEDDRSTDESTGLVIGGDSQRASLYLKEPATGSLKDEHLRFEVRARKDWLHKAGLFAVADLTHARVYSFAVERWRWSRMGSAIETPDRLLRHIATTSALLDSERAAFAGWLAGRQCGVDLPIPSRAVLRRFKEAEARLAAVDGALLSMQQMMRRENRWGRLYFDRGIASRGTVVTRRAKQAE